MCYNTCMEAATPVTFQLTGRTTHHFRGRLTWHPFALGILAAGATYALRGSPPVAVAAGVGTTSLSAAIAMRYITGIRIDQHVEGLPVPGQASTPEEFMERLRSLGRVECTLTEEAGDIQRRQDPKTKEVAGRRVPSQFAEDVERTHFVVAGQEIKYQDSRALFEAINALIPDDSALFDDSVRLLSQGSGAVQWGLVAGLFTGAGHSPSQSVNGKSLWRREVAVEEGVVTYTHRQRWFILGPDGEGGFGPTGYTVDGVSTLTRGQPECQTTLFAPVQREAGKLLTDPLQT
jgi:hypothetical protein